MVMIRFLYSVSGDIVHYTAIFSRMGKGEQVEEIDLHDRMTAEHISKIKLLLEMLVS